MKKWHVPGVPVVVVVTGGHVLCADKLASTAKRCHRVCGAGQWKRVGMEPQCACKVFETVTPERLNEHAVKLLSEALCELSRAADKLNAMRSKPGLPEVRVPTVHIGPDMYWPWRPGDQPNLRFIHIQNYDHILHSFDCTSNVDAAKHILSAIGPRPRLLLHALRGIQYAAAWCRARVEGLQRHEREILRQHWRSVKALLARRSGKANM